jgi:flagellar biosynthesis chaperone FliJ
VDRAAGNPVAPGSVESVADELQQAAAHYESAIQQLEVLAKNGDQTLTPDVATTLQRNLTVIDQAIGESRTALQQHPESEPARASLFEALRRKVTMLQTTVALMNEMRKGDADAVAKITGRKSSS